MSTLGDKWGAAENIIFKTESHTVHVFEWTKEALLCLLLSMKPCGHKKAPALPPILQKLKDISGIIELSNT